MCSNVVSWVDGYENIRLGVACVFLQPVKVIEYHGQIQGGGIQTP